MTRSAPTTYYDLNNLGADTPSWGLFNQMAGKSLRVQNAIALALLFALGAFILLVSCYDFYHWCVTGNLYAPSKYDHHGRYVSYGETPGLFLAACAKSLIGAVAGIVFIVQAFRAPSEFRKKEQARLASLKQSPPHPWRPD